MPRSGDEMDGNGHARGVAGVRQARVEELAEHVRQATKAGPRRPAVHDRGRYLTDPRECFAVIGVPGTSVGRRISGKTWVR